MITFGVLKSYAHVCIRYMTLEPEKHAEGAPKRRIPNDSSMSHTKRPAEVCFAPTIIERRHARERGILHEYNISESLSQGS